MQASISTCSGSSLQRCSSIILSVKLKHDYEETVETGAAIISLAIIERT
jgi:hypothetical protein